MKTIDAVAWDAFVADSANGNMFHTQRFFGYHPSERYRWDHAEIRDGDDMIGLWPAAAADGGRTWWSGAGASFGGPVVAELDRAEHVVAGVIEEARRRGYERLKVTPPPSIYEPEQEGVVREALRRAGFECEHSAVFESAPIGGVEPIAMLDPKARRGAGKAIREGIEVTRGTIDDYAEFHALLVRDRAEMGLVPVHTGPEMEDLARRFPERATLLLARREGQLVAGGWMLQVSDRMALSFYVCQNREFRKLRGMNLVMLRALEWATEREVWELDYGVSSPQDAPSPGLSRFKEAHGGRPHDRETFVRSVG